jgi:hypothetical protein
MRFSAIASLIVLVQTQSSVAFVPSSLASVGRTQQTSLSASVDTEKKEKKIGGSSVELGIPCEDECALVKFPKLPDSIYPGVLSGQAQIDLLNHAKENGEWKV